MILSFPEECLVGSKQYLFQKFPNMAVVVISLGLLFTQNYQNVKKVLSSPTLGQNCEEISVCNMFLSGYYLKAHHL